MRRFLLVGVLALVGLASFAASAATAADPAPEPTSLEKTSAITTPSIAYLTISYTSKVYDTFNKTYLGDGDPFKVQYSCTGFFVNPDGYVGTAGHCVAYDADVKAALVSAAAEWAYENGYYEKKTLTLEDIQGFAEDDYVTRGGHTSEFKVSYGVSASGIGQPRTLPARLLGAKAFEKGDVALLKIEAGDLPGLELLGDPSEVQVGMEIVSIGFPGSVDDVTDANAFNPSFKDGKISSKKTIGGGLVPVYEVSAAVSHGMSGGPTVNLDSAVIGINSFGILGETQPFNFVTPSALMLELMRDKGVKNEIGTVGTLYREGLEAYWNGDKSEALKKFNATLDISPSFASAQEYKAKAAVMEDESSGTPWLWILLGVVVIGGLGALVAVLLLRRRGGGQAAVVEAAPPAAGSAAAATPATEPPALAPGPASTAESDVPALVFLTADGHDGERITLTGAEMVIGRENADIHVEDSEVSRRHASVSRQDGRLELTDLSSANGTEVNGERVEKAVLSDGDVITVGKTSLRVSLPASSPGATVIRPTPFPSTNE